MISNYHVVKDAARVRLVTSAGTVPAKVVQVDAADDLALLKADGHFAPLPVISSRAVKLGGTVATVGFPDPGLQGFAPKVHESLQLEIIAVLESLEQLKESAEFELCGIIEQKPGALDELAAERIKLLEKERAELQRQADDLAKEIEELSGEATNRIG